MSRVLVLCNDVVGERMAGPGIRYWEFARALAAAGFDTTLAVVPFVPASPQPSAIPFNRLRYCQDDAEVRALASESNVIITQGVLLAPYPFLTDLRVPLVLDLYIPFLLERLNLDTNVAEADHLFTFEAFQRVFNLQLGAADLIVCASEKQRDYYLGALSALGRVNPYSHSADPTLHQLIDVVPFGLPADPPHHTRQVLKGIHPGIAASDKVIVWGGGIWNWLDAPTLLRAMGRLSDRRPDIKLWFMGVQRPSGQSEQMRAGEQAISLSRELGLYDRTVFFSEWVPYADRASYLLEADLGLSLHRDHLETRFSFRTRFLDYMWAGLPIVASRGDVLSEQAETYGLGRVVEPGDEEGLTEAILSLLDTPNLRETYRPRFERIAARYRWDVVTRPLVEFCAAPRLAPDRAYLRESSVADLGPTPVWRLPRKAWRALRLGGARRLARQIDEFLRWQMKRRGAHRG